MILRNKRITKVLIRLRGCAGWLAPFLFAHPREQVFSRRGPIIKKKIPATAKPGPSTGPITGPGPGTGPRAGLLMGTWGTGGPGNGIGAGPGPGNFIGPLPGVGPIGGRGIGTGCGP